MEGITSLLEKTRDKMYRSIQINGVNSKETIEISKLLDNLIILCQKIEFEGKQWSLVAWSHRDLHKTKKVT